MTVRSAQYNEEESTMSATLKEQLAELSELAPQVHATTDRVNALIARMEDVLVKDMAVGLHAETSAFEERALANKTRVVEHLSLGSIGDREQIHVVERTWGKDGGLVSEQQIPWSDCSRATRLKAIAVLPELVANLVADARKLMEEANETATRVSGWISGEEAAATEVESNSRPHSTNSRAAETATRRRGKK
jgi:hypothetical protein